MEGDIAVLRCREILQEELHISVPAPERDDRGGRLPRTGEERAYTKPPVMRDKVHNKSPYSLVTTPLNVNCNKYNTVDDILPTSAHGKQLLYVSL